MTSPRRVQQEEREPLLNNNNNSTGGEGEEGHDLENGQATTGPAVGGGSKPSLSTLIKLAVKSRPFIISSSVLLVIFSIYVIVYHLVMPPTIQAAINGQGSVLKHLHLLDISPIKAEVSVLIPIQDPKPISAKVHLGDMTIYDLNPPSKLTPSLPLASFSLGDMDVVPSADQIWLNTTVEIVQPNFGWLTYFLSQGVKHGFQETHLSLSGRPVIGIPLMMSSWGAILDKRYSFDPRSNSSRIDPAIFNASATDFEVDQSQTPKGTKFSVSLLAHFKNPFPVSIGPLSVSVNFWIHFKGQPILNVYTSPTSPSNKVAVLSLVEGYNKMSIYAESVPENAGLLLELVGIVAGGVDADVLIKNVRFLTPSNAPIPGGKIGKWEWIQDLVDVLGPIPLTIPGMTEEFRSRKNYSDFIMKILSMFGSGRKKYEQI